jgi:K+/H+ antiporter YhaU regulatory subunit KhtT
VDNVQIDPKAPSVGKTLSQLDLRKLTGATVIAIVRSGEAVKNPAPDFSIGADDILVLLGSHVELDRAVNLLTRGIISGE